MHPILADRRRLAVYLLAWLLIGLLFLFGLRRDAGWLASAFFFLPVSLLFGFISLSSGYICRGFPIGVGKSVWRIIGAHVLAAAVASALWVGIAGAWSTAIESLGLGDGAERLFAQQQVLLFVLGALLFWLASALHYLLIAFEAAREAETRTLELSLLAREAELKALRAQIDPHFIFNSLHSISALTSIDPAAARRMCLLLADFLRDTLRLGASSRIALSEEFALAERFLAIEQVRLGDRLHVTRDTTEDAVACLVPPLLLQPLVENAVVHGVAQLVDGGTIRMAAFRDASILTITLENPCDPDRAKTRGVGLGLELLRKRLTTQYGAYDAVRANEQLGHFRVEVRIPVVTAA
jgi:sensor histidine kinase YesM